jgi:MYXO-CTERM domain-containing protein
MRATPTLAAWLITVLFTGAAGAQNLVDLTGQVRLGDGLSPRGTRIRLEVDLDRNGKFSSFETLTATAGDDGAYTVRYSVDPRDVDLQFISFVTQLLADFQTRGFDALLDGGPLSAVVTFEREGYSTTVRRLATMFERPSLDALLAPLRDVACSAEGCQTADGSIVVSGFRGGTGINRAFAQAYDPSLDTPRFPGSFADSNDNLLISSGFAEIDLRDEAGEQVTSVSDPVAVRFAADRSSWSTLVDLQPGTGRIEVPMYSFNERSAQWDSEADGELQDAQGAAIPEDRLAAIVAGEYDQPVFIAFRTTHFSTWNCDRPVQTRTCVKGRLVETGGTPLPGVAVNVTGVSYTGTNGTVVTGTDGWFATDVMKSEQADEDIDNNGQRGETFTARVTATGAAGVFAGEPFETPTLQRATGRFGTPNCLPQDCDCPTLGDVVARFEAPRLCEVTVSATFSGRHLVGEGGTLVAGDPVAGARVRGELSGELSVPAGACGAEPCGSGRADAEGQATFSVPVLGDAPRIQLHAEHQVTAEGKVQLYSATNIVDGCAAGEDRLAGTVELSLDHSSLSGMADFIAALGAGPRTNGDGERPQDEFGDLRGCGCSTPASSGTPGRFALWVPLGLAALALWRRRR